MSQQLIENNWLIVDLTSLIQEEAEAEKPIKKMEVENAVKPIESKEPVQKDSSQDKVDEESRKELMTFDE